MRIVTYNLGEMQRAGLQLDDVVVDAQDAATAGGLGDGQARAWRSAKMIVGQPQSSLDALAEGAALCAAAGRVLDYADLELGPPIPDPQKIICLGLNYRAHAEEVDAEVPQAPDLFTKFPSSLLGPNGTIQIPSITQAVDYEGELAVVINRACRNVSQDEALSHVAGCMVLNDVTARDLQARTSQWTAGKAIDTFAPCGPALVSLDEIDDLDDLHIQTRVNGTTLQDESTARMMYSIPETIAFVSRLMTLLPGDIIATGTPAGVGFQREPPVYLSPGDVVEVEIAGIGCLSNRVAADLALVGDNDSGMPVRAARGE